MAAFSRQRFPSRRSCHAGAPDPIAPEWLIYPEGAAIHTGPELCAVHREVAGEALVAYVQAGYPAPVSASEHATVRWMNEPYVEGLKAP
jgi:hypothetical protein